MDRRKHKRIKKSMILKVNNKPGNLIDISPNGLRLSTAISQTPRDIDIALKAENKNMNLQGIIQWIRNYDQRKRSAELGVRIPNPPQEYQQFLDTLSWDSSGQFEYGWVLIVLSVMLLIGVVYGMLTLFDLIRF
jgi:hypothetical protein